MIIESAQSNRSLVSCLIHSIADISPDLSGLALQHRYPSPQSYSQAARPPNPAELLSSTRMRTFLQEIKGRYDDRFVIIDSAPTHITPEAKVLAEYVDGIIFVIMAERPPRKEIQKVIDNLGRDKILGIVFNGYSQVDKGYYKYYEE